MGIFLPTLFTNRKVKRFYFCEIFWVEYREVLYLMNPEFFEALTQLEKAKGIKREILIDAIRDALASAYKKNFKADQQNIHVEFDSKEGFKVLSRKQVVETVSNPKQQIALSEARKKKENCNIGDIIEIEVTPSDFGRIAAQTAKQVITQRIKEAERSIVYKSFKEKIGEVITGIVQRVTKHSILVDLGKAEGILPAKEQIAKEKYKVGDRIKSYILDVKMTPKGPQITLSRTYPDFVKKLFDLEVPEIYEGIVEIKGVSREPGIRSKIAVASKDVNVDPVGACVGMKGMRVQAIISELSGERIDIAQYDEDPEEFIKNALSPARITSVTIDKKKRSAVIVVPDQQLSLAIGKEGQNVRLAAKLTGWKIDIQSESEAMRVKGIKAKKEAEKKLFKEPVGESGEEATTSPEEKPKQQPEQENQKKPEPVPLETLTGIDKRILKCLQETGITTVDQIKDMSVENLTKIKGIGKTSAEKIYNAIHQ